VNGMARLDCSGGAPPDRAMGAAAGTEQPAWPTRSTRAAMQPGPPMTLGRRLSGAGPAVTTPFDAVPKALTSQPLILFRRTCIAAP